MPSEAAEGLKAGARVAFAFLVILGREAWLRDEGAATAERQTSMQSGRMRLRRQREGDDGLFVSALRTSVHVDGRLFLS